MQNDTEDMFGLISLNRDFTKIKLLELNPAEALRMQEHQYAEDLANEDREGAMRAFEARDDRPCKEL